MGLFDWLFGSNDDKEEEPSVEEKHRDMMFQWHKDNPRDDKYEKMVSRSDWTDTTSNDVD